MFFYGGYSFTHVNTQSIDQEAVYSDDGQDYLYTRFIINFQTIIHRTIAPDQIAGLNVGEPKVLDNSSCASLMRTLRHQLLQPGRRLAYWVNPDPGNEPLIKVGTDLNLPDPPNRNTNFNGLPDMKGGPFPRHCLIRQVAGTETLHVDYAIETYLIECADGGEKPEIISHRFRETSHIDENFYTTRTRTGTIHVRSDVISLAAGETADKFRQNIMPAIPKGFKRESVEVAVTEDRFKATYTIKDVEQFLLPPFPATKADGRYKESDLGTGGGLRQGDCWVSLEGPNSEKSTKDELFKAALLICLSKLSQGATKLDGQNGRPILQSASFEEELWRNKVTVAIKAVLTSSPLRVKTKDGKGGVPSAFKNFGTPIPGVPLDGTPPDPGARGTAGLAIYGPQWQDPCSKSPEIPINAQTLANFFPGVAPTDVKVQQVKALPDDREAVHNPKQQQGAPYTDYQLYPKWGTNEHKLQLPIANAAAGFAAVFVQVAKPTTKLIIEWSASRVGETPEIPDKTPPDANMVLLDEVVAPESREPEGDGTVFRYTIMGRYEYGFKVEPRKHYPWTLMVDAGKAIAKQVKKGQKLSVFGLFGKA